jgi:hypothetical protein
VPFLRLTRDRRGYENTFLLHSMQPGEQPRVLYWYRSAPGVRVGRPPLDEDAIRTIEEQHPEVEFDWPHILEVGAAQPPEVEERTVRPPRRQPGKRREDREEAEVATPTAQAQGPRVDEIVLPAEDIEDASEESAEPPRPRAHDLLEELAGREIATRLHARYAEIIARIHRLPVDHAQRNAWEARAEALNPDNWVTPGEVLAGVQRADELFDVLRRELLAH